MRSAIQKAPPLREQVVHALMQELRSGRLQPGERLTELGIAEQLDVSRTPVREALNQLVEQGLLEARPRGGYLVPSPTVSEIRDIIAVRMLLEPPAIAALALHCSAAERNRIDEAISGEKALVDADTPAFAQANEVFRISLFGGLVNRVHRDVIAQFSGHLNFIRASTLHDRELRREIIAMQCRVRDAIFSGDGTTAAQSWREYLAHAEHSLIAVMQHLGKDT